MNTRCGAALCSLGALALLAVACGSTPPRPSEGEERAVALNKRAQAAYRSGELREALALHQQALAANRAIEHSDGIAAELMNIAALQWQLGEHVLAHAALDEIVIQPAVPFAGAQRAEAAYRKAYFFFEDGQQTQAGEWLEQTRTLCGAKECAADGKAGNLRARMALARGDAAGAVEQARAALGTNRKHGERAEQANSLRLLGDATLQRADLTVAYQAYADALEIDKELGAARKIGLDLLGMGQALLAQGRKSEAADVFLRARSVFAGLGDEAAARLAGEQAERARP